MKRGEIWAVAGGKDYAGKPRPVVIVQDDSFDGTASITICAYIGYNRSSAFSDSGHTQ
jgi:mRNA interferase MazF